MPKKINRRTILKQGSIVFATLTLPLNRFQNIRKMQENNFFDVIIIGGSYAGLSAAMSLGRSLRKVLIIDSGKPCNRQTPHSHNLITQDGEQPSAIAQKAKEQVLRYDTVSFCDDLAVEGIKDEAHFLIKTQKGNTFIAKKLVFATGLKDIMPDISGFADCWGISLIHCPYCHGYEVKNKKTGVIANGDHAFHYAQLVSNLTQDMTLFTNGEAYFSTIQLAKLQQHRIPIIEKEIARLTHDNGHLKTIIFKDGSSFDLQAIYYRPNFEQHCNIPETLGCEITEQGLLKVDLFQKTSIEHVFACGDNSSPLRSVASAIATGNITGAMVNKEFVEESF